MFIRDRACSSLEQLCDTLQSLYEGGKVSSLRIFVDEVIIFRHKSFPNKDTKIAKRNENLNLVQRYSGLLLFIIYYL